jgi:catechol 2,3-dioxygenase-like lactoylglutathione lyase family enzyme/DNA-binding CsgD family transcriptional regulator
MGGKRGRPRHPDVLTPAEWAVADAIRHGMRGPEIARRRGVSVDAVKFHVANIMDKAGLRDRAAIRAWRGVPAGSALANTALANTALARRAGTGKTGKERQVPEEEFRLGVIGQVSRNVSDVAAAVAWYGQVLGLPHLYTVGDLAFFDCGGVRLFLSQEHGSGGQESVLYFQVPDINAAYDTLTARGASFQGAPHMIVRHESGVEEWMAFFPDPDGHLLAIMSQVRP